MSVKPADPIPCYPTRPALTVQDPTGNNPHQEHLQAMFKLTHLTAALLMTAILAVTAFQPARSASEVEDPFRKMEAADYPKALNDYTSKYPTVNAFAQFAAPFAKEDRDLFAIQLWNAIKTVQDFGYGSGKLGIWQAKQMPIYRELAALFDPKLTCEQHMATVYYTTITHGAKNYQFGFWVNEGNGFLSAAALKAKTLGKPCF